MIDRAATNDPILIEALRKHPKINQVQESQLPGIQFQQGDWQRQVVAGDISCEIRGLVELMDNNPMVCADEVSVPDCASTMALVGLGPLFWAGLVIEPPTAIFSFDDSLEKLDGFLSTVGWSDGITVHTEAQSLGTVVAATLMAVIRTPNDLTEIDDLFEERYGKAFFVRRDEDSTWDPSLVAGQPWAHYRLRISAGEGSSLLTVLVMADRNGKAGRSQLIHAMNVMAGFEESIGVA